MATSFILMHNNAKAPTHLVNDILKSKDIGQMGQRVRSLDIYTLENVCNALGAIATSSENHPGPENSVTELVESVAAETQNCLITSMKPRCEACLCVRRDHTPYQSIFCSHFITTVSFLSFPMSIMHDHSYVLYLLNGYIFCIISTYRFKPNSIKICAGCQVITKSENPLNIEYQYTK